ncbi:hypothetical protein HRG_002640 [Hirsutella rhossiliensis]|uniref:DUF3074 domain-containing protein n=1 Tax=Hirsutella rhossiliensis TaxID=111463 RepID=A0A9P8SLR7_9HYPO|nr:uncharacterized protein HRG_02640 [Hirsutella rhossiliensis]KAH0967231.1 hypothetical protein HRG_02640 [Hirsutella rhossiliensis]
MADKYGPLIRLWGVDVSSQLPSPSASSEELRPLLKSILSEALPFIETIPSSAPPSTSAASSPSTTSTTGDSSSPWKAKGVKTFPHSISPVHLFERTVPAAALASVAKEHALPPSVVDASSQVRAETWAARRSVHEDAAARGTASWAEWVRCFKDDHAEAEREFTPTVLSTRVRRQWDDCGGVDVDGWTDWTLKLEESVHKLPPPLKARVFPVLQATASARGRRDFVVVQIAAVAPRADNGGDDGGGSAVRGVYTSVERLRETPGGIEWTMATASDAGGVLPAWVQRMAVPTQIAKDVDMFLSWIAEERDKGANKGAR